MFERYLAPVEAEQLAKLLEQSCAWFEPIADLEPVALTKLGDVVLRDRDDAAYFLDTTFGVVEMVAASRGGFFARLANPAFASALLRTGLADELEDLVLAPGQCFGFGVSPLLGGPITRANVSALDAGVVLAWLGELVRTTVPMADGQPVRLSQGRRRREPSYGSLTKQPRDRGPFAISEAAATRPRA